MWNRPNFFKIRFGRIEKLANRRLGKSPDEGGKFGWSEFIIILATAAFANQDRLPETLPHRELIAAGIPTLILLVGLAVGYYRLAPRSCWHKATYATALLATAWSVVPWILYLINGENFSLNAAIEVSIGSLVVWAITLGCYLRYRYIRRRSQQEIAMMRIRERRRRNTQYL